MHSRRIHLFRTDCCHCPLRVLELSHPVWLDRTQKRPVCRDRWPSRDWARPNCAPRHHKTLQFLLRVLRARPAQPQNRRSGSEARVRSGHLLSRTPSRLLVPSKFDRDYAAPGGLAQAFPLFSRHPPRLRPLFRRRPPSSLLLFWKATRSSQCPARLLPYSCGLCAPLL